MDDDTLDDDLRAALDADVTAVDRVVLGALRQERPRPRLRRIVLMTAGAAALLVVSVVVLHRSEPPVAPGSTHVTNIGNTIVVRPASGGVWLIGRDGREDDRLPPGTIVVYRSGAIR